MWKTSAVRFPFVFVSFNLSDPLHARTHAHPHARIYRDNFLRELLGYPALSDAELTFQRKTWAASTAMSMYTEFVSIVTSRILYLAFRQHRFVINLGYGFGSGDENMTTLTILITSVFVELIFEAVVDAYALEVERDNGINLEDFWEMWKVVSLGWNVK